MSTSVKYIQSKFANEPFVIDTTTNPKKKHLHVYAELDRAGDLYQAIKSFFEERGVELAFIRNDVNGYERNAVSIMSRIYFRNHSNRQLDKPHVEFMIANIDDDLFGLGI